jgi:succinate-semialdehyde dehydrogenase
MNGDRLIQEMIGKAKKAQGFIAGYDQKQIDRLVRAIGKTVFDNAEELARLAVDETGMGVYKDKIAKNKGKARIIWNDLKDKRSVDIIDYNDEEMCYYVAKPMGVVGAVTPTTNPIVTPMSNAMFAVKGRNSIIIAPHPRAKGCSAWTVRLISQELARLGAPKDLIQIIEEPTIELTQALMRAVDIVVATGGMGMVKAAYSSGKPSLGVGAGNVQVIIDADTNFNAAAQKVIFGRKFDNGIICSGEQFVFAPNNRFSEVIAAFMAGGAFYIEDQDVVDRYREVLFPGGDSVNKEVVGQSVKMIAEKARSQIPEKTKVILLRAKGAGEKDVLCREKMCSVLGILPYRSFEEAVEMAHENLKREGSGHTAVVHSENRQHIEYTGINLPISRLVVNAPSSTTAGGSFFNAFAPTTTLGCGSWGNNSQSENITFKHFINISRIGLVNDKRKAPTDEEIWAEI